MVMDRDVEGSGVRQALIQGKKIGRYDDRHGKGSIGVVLLSTFVAVCGSFEFGLCVGYSAPTQAALIEELHLSLAEFSLFGAILNIGATIGAATSGPLADLNGRKWTLGISAAICIGAWIMVFFSKTAWSLDVGRCLSGYGIGVISYVVPVFIAEITPKNIRGTLTTINQLLICSGVSFGMIVGTFVSWRTLALTGIVPCVILILGLLFIPESPRWLAKVGRDQDFEDALQRLRGKDADTSEEAVEIREYVESLESSPKARIGDLFQRRYARSVIVGVGLILLQQCGGINGFAFYISEIFLSAGFSSSNLGTIGYAAVQIPFTALGAVITDKSGRRPLLLVSATGTFIGSFLTGVSFYLKEHYAALTWSPFLAFIGVLIYISSFSLGMGAIPWVIMSEIFALNIKGIAGSMVTFVHWVAAWLIAYAFNFLILWSASGTFFTFAGFCAATILFIAKLVPETKGRTLEEIQASMNS